MIVELKVTLTEKEKEILSKARDIANDLSDAIRNTADNVTGIEEGVIREMYDRADVCDEAWAKLGDLCDEFGCY